MCGRYYTRAQKQEVATRMRVPPERVFTAPYPPDFNIAPSTAQPIVRLE